MMVRACWFQEGMQHELSLVCVLFRVGRALCVVTRLCPVSSRGLELVRGTANATHQTHGSYEIPHFNNTRGIQNNNDRYTTKKRKKKKQKNKRICNWPKVGPYVSCALIPTETHSRPLTLVANQ
ncbi:hypothetical protein VTK26DRAFT_5618 [Humicola hyalothermophila]